VKRFSEAIASLTRDALDMEELSDRYAEVIQDLVQEKAKKGKDIVQPSAAESEEEEEGGAEVIDLVKLLKQRTGATGRATPKPPSKADGSPGALKNLSKNELYERAQDLHIPGRSKMTKADLMKAIQKGS
jgi:DNA end-binding protein Ku